MNTYNLTEPELQELLRKQREICADAFHFKYPGVSYPDILNAPLPPLPSGAKKEDIQPVLRWVKVEKRLPKKRHNYHVKVFTKSAVGDYVYNAARLFNGKYFEQEGYPEKKENVIEWLEESDLSTAPLKASYESDAVAFAEWLTKSDSPYAVLYGEKDRWCTTEENFTTEYLYQIFQQEKQKP